MRASFVIPSYNTAAWLPHAVKSCLEQTHKDIEVVIVDDCSTDTTGEYLTWLESQGDKRIKIVRFDKNQGRSAARNAGNEAATGEVIFVLDSDDLAIPTRVEWTLKKMKNGAKVIYGSAVVMDALGNALGEKIATAIDLKTAIERKENGIFHSSMAYTKDLAKKYKYSEGDIGKLGIDDWHLQIRMLHDGIKFDHITDVICAYRQLEGTISTTRDMVAVNKTKDSVLMGLQLEAVK